MTQLFCRMYNRRSIHPWRLSAHVCKMDETRVGMHMCVVSMRACVCVCDA